MQAELILRVAADPNAIGKLEGNELCELLAEAEPPTWVFVEAARRRLDERVIAHLFSHSEAGTEVLERAFTCNTALLDRFKHHLNVFEGELELSEVFANIVPEELGVSIQHPILAALLEANLSPLCLYFLDKARTKRTKDETRAYIPLSRFLLLGDFLSYLSCGPVATPNDLPVMAKVALALNPQQPLEPYLKDADLRVRCAAKERSRWNEN